MTVRSLSLSSFVPLSDVQYLWQLIILSSFYLIILFSHLLANNKQSFYRENVAISFLGCSCNDGRSAAPWPSTWPDSSADILLHIQLKNLRQCGLFKLLQPSHTSASRSATHIYVRSPFSCFSDPFHQIRITADRITVIFWWKCSWLNCGESKYKDHKSNGIIKWGF